MALVSIITPVLAKTERDVEWLQESIESVLAQTHKDWELFIVNDHSKISLGPLGEYFKDKRIHGAMSKGQGVAQARNQAAELSTSGLLLPLDHDDKLAPEALEKLLAGWEACGNGVIYGDTVLFGDDFSRIYHSPPFNVDLMLKQLLLPVGGLHSKQAWQESGGWKSQMSMGLEDWEYWLTLMEKGHCGHHIAEVVYYYRRHPTSRLSKMLASSNGYKVAYSKMRDIHADLFAGRIKVVCGGCGGGIVAGGTPQQPASTQMTAMEVSQLPAGGRVSIGYFGRRSGTFYMTGRPSGARYAVSGIGSEVMGPDGRTGVLNQDVLHILRLDAGASFKRI